MVKIDLKKTIREIPDFPKPGILFYDITTMLKDPDALDASLEQMYDLVKHLDIDKVVAIESRGFIFAVPLAQRFNAGFVPVRKPNKLPAEKYSINYDLEYGSNTIEMHKDAVEPGEKVLLVDDLLATGGTMSAAVDLVEKAGGDVLGILFMIELSFLNGREKFKDKDIYTVLEYGE